jgi:peptide-methionine (R)-S-oxide reductase
MNQKQILWLASSSACLCAAVAWLSLSSADLWRATHAQTNPAIAARPVAFGVPSDGDKTDKANASITKRKKTVNAKDDGEVEYNRLTPDEARVILRKGTERPFTGEYTNLKDPGTYICRRCNAALYHSDTKFESHCGWPSFDDEIKGAVKHRRETDGTGRVEIVCANCGGHLGHVFFGEGFTQKNTRHCVNSVSMRFVPNGKPLPEVIKPKSAKDAEKKVATDKPVADETAAGQAVSEKPASDKTAADKGQ